MPRAAAFSRDSIVDAARVVAASGGPGRLSIAGLGQELGAPTGSIYHRFKSRDELLASVWMDAVETFQAALWVSAETHHDPGSLSRSIVTWCREHPTLAKILTLYRREEWLGRRVSKATRARAARLNEPVGRFLEERASRWLGTDSPEAVAAVQLAIVQVPTAAVEDWLRRDAPIPPWIDAAVDAAARAVLAEFATCR
ncbi:MAG: TetR/AcrR family transcriptional regulator [Polyangiales bacterium]